MIRHYYPIGIREWPNHISIEIAPGGLSVQAKHYLPIRGSLVDIVLLETRRL
jgi:hypothetical protein